MLQPVVIDGIRTPIGKLNGAMKDIQAGGNCCLFVAENM